MDAFRLLVFTALPRRLEAVVVETRGGNSFNPTASLDRVEVLDLVRGRGSADMSISGGCSGSFSFLVDGAKEDKTVAGTSFFRTGQTREQLLKK